MSNSAGDTHVVDRGVTQYLNKNWASLCSKGPAGIFFIPCSLKAGWQGTVVQ